MNKQCNSVLVIDSDEQTRRYLRVGFRVRGGFSVRETITASEGIKAATLYEPDLIVLGSSLPGIYLSLILEQIRSRSDVPIIILSSDSTELEKVRLFALGADDYLVKPFGIAELIARCNAAIRRQYKGPAKNPVVVAGRLKVDLARRAALLDDNPIRLSPQQSCLLRLLAMNVDVVVTHDQLLQAIWGSSRRTNLRHLRVLFRELRRTIEVDPNRPQILITEWGVGYRLRSDFEAD